ncbi:MAG: hypothetical protein JO297_13855 [Nitrososphaeraceae archaeon]|nr:hypothetical protein [Nitrososphaeraceae archaeon]
MQNRLKQKVVDITLTRAIITVVTQEQQSALENKKEFNFDLFAALSGMFT